MQLFYTPDINGSEYDLNEVESKHAVRVLRLSNGDYLQLIDGKGNFYEAQIAEANPKKCRVSVTKHFPEFEKRNHHLHLAVAPTKNIDRFEWFMEKATEIGVDEITPILCSHSERKVVKGDRLEKVAIAAMKQSLKAYLPKVNPLVSFNDLINTGFEGKKFIAHCHEQDKLELKNELSNSSSILILIGPEGDFSEEEIKMATEKQFIPVSLGKSRLRTETAAIVACHTVNLMKG